MVESCPSCGLRGAHLFTCPRQPRPPLATNVFLTIAYALHDAVEVALTQLERERMQTGRAAVVGQADLTRELWAFHDLVERLIIRAKATLTEAELAAHEAAS